MRFTADITLKRTYDGEVLDRFNVEYFTNEGNDANYAEFLSFLSTHETYIENNTEMSYEGDISVNGITKAVSKEFLNELYDVLE